MGMENTCQWKGNRLESIKQAFLNGEFSYEGAVQKLYDSRTFYSLKVAREKVDSWKAEVRVPCIEQRGKRLPVINETASFPHN